jgi:RNA polymerase sigma-70 factor, ECF subfamily
MSSSPTVTAPSSPAHDSPRHLRAPIVVLPAAAPAPAATAIETAVREFATTHRQADTARQSDGALIARAQAGDAAAFAVVYDRHAAAAYSLAYRMTHARSSAQDVVQESFLSLWRTDSYRADKGSLRNFVLGIVRNRAIDAMRKEGRRGARERSDEAAVLGLAARDRTDDEVEQREAQRLLRGALAALPEAQQQALELAFFEGLTNAEIAEHLDTPIGTIKGRIRLGLNKLRAEVDPASYR